MVFLFLLPALLSAQQTAVVYGILRNKDKQIIPNANITLVDHPGGTTSNKDGAFEIKVPAGTKIRITISCIGYEPETFEVKLAAGERKESNLQLSKSTTELESVEVRDQQMKTNTFNRLDPKTVNLIPSANASIEDLIKTLPGVSSRNEMSSQYSVRGWEL